MSQKLADNFEHFFKVSRRDFLVESLANLNGVTDFSKKKS